MNKQGPSSKEVDIITRLERLRASRGKAQQALRERVLSRISSGVWHTTSLERFGAILQTGAILPEPDLADTERWSTSAGPQWYPYVRTLGGVSLFDFRDFDPESYQERCPASTWAEFVPYRDAWGAAIWIEIDVSRLTSEFVSGRDLLRRWKSAGVGNRIMPEIEAAHIGPLPIDAFLSAFIARKGISDLEPVDVRGLASGHPELETYEPDYAK